MSVTIQVDLPDAVAAEARARGLLDPKRVASLIARELTSESDPRSFFEIIRKIQGQPGEAMTDEEVVAEVEAARRERRARESGG